MCYYDKFGSSWTWNEFEPPEISELIQADDDAELIDVFCGMRLGEMQQRKYVIDNSVQVKECGIVQEEHDERLGHVPWTEKNEQIVREGCVAR